MEKEYKEEQKLHEKPAKISTLAANHSSKNQSMRLTRKDKGHIGIETRYSTLFMEPAELKPEIVAYELRQIQQRLFCQIESSEIARYILKPYTVTEVIMFIINLR